jgi:predicted nucleic acid-binding protein
MENYSSFLENRVEDELPFSTFHTTRETVNIAITSLGHGKSDPDGADNCLERVRDSDLFEVHYCSPEVYASVVEDFLTFDDREISIQEVVLARIAETEDVQHIATWDSDFTRYTDRVTLYPRNFWES